MSHRPSPARLPRRGLLRLGALAAVLPAGALLAACVPADRPVTGPAPGPGGAAEGVEGRVTDGRGRPVAGAFVTAAGTGANPNPVPEIAVFTDAAGRYRWYLRAGSYAITVTAETLGRSTLAVSVPRGGVVRLDFVLG